MPLMECVLRNQIGIFPFAQEVEVMGKSGARIRVRCLGFTNKNIARSRDGHYVKVIAERYSVGNNHVQASWVYVSVDEAMLGWRTEFKGEWVVYLLLGERGVPIVVPRTSKPSLTSAG